MVRHHPHLAKPGVRASTIDPRARIRLSPPRPACSFHFFWSASLSTPHTPFLIFVRIASHSLLSQELRFNTRLMNITTLGHGRERAAVLVGVVVPTAASYHEIKPHQTVVQFKNKAAGGTGEAKKEASLAGEVRAKDGLLRVRARLEIDRTCQHSRRANAKKTGCH